MQSCKEFEIVISKYISLGYITYLKNFFSVFSWNYRSAEHHQPKFLTVAAEGITGVMWWWILWHLWTEPGHVFVSYIANTK